MAYKQYKIMQIAKDFRAEYGAEIKAMIKLGRNNAGEKFFLAIGNIYVEIGVGSTARSIWLRYLAEKTMSAKVA